MTHSDAEESLAPRETGKQRSWSELLDAAQQRAVAVTDLVPAQPGDGNGLAGFYLVIGWIVGRYLVASLLGVARGSRPANRRRAIFRLGAIVP
jgi:hypothetical protein